MREILLKQRIACPDSGFGGSPNLLDPQAFPAQNETIFDPMKFLSVPFLVVLFLLAQYARAQNPSAAFVRSFIANEVTGYHIPPEQVSVVRDEKVLIGTDSVGIRIYQPASTGTFPVIYLVHGGAYVGGDLDTHDNICRHLANALQAVVVSVNYRRPTEYKFPVAFEDSYSVFKWVNANRKTLHGNGRLILLGDSAGGQIVASICLVNAADTHPIPITAQVLVNPATNMDFPAGPGNMNSIFLQWYLNPTDDRKDIRLSPLLARDFSNDPPAIIVVGEKDELRSQGEEFSKKLMAAGIVSTLFVQPNIGHLAGRWCATQEKAKPAIDFVVQTIKENYLK
jgi:acetyl esterase